MIGKPQRKRKLDNFRLEEIIKTDKKNVLCRPEKAAADA
jgi:hypothetical protein